MITTFENFKHFLDIKSLYFLIGVRRQSYWKVWVLSLKSAWNSRRWWSFEPYLLKFTYFTPTLCITQIYPQKHLRNGSNEFHLHFQAFKKCVQLCTLEFELHFQFSSIQKGLSFAPQNLSFTFISKHSKGIELCILESEKSKVF